MKKHLCVGFLATLVTLLSSGAAWAQALSGGTIGGGTNAGGAGGDEVISPDNGNVLNSPPPAVDKVNSWVSRSFSKAVAVTAYEDPQFNVPMANVRLYAKTTTGYAFEQIKMTVDGTAYSLNVVPVRLEKVEDSLARLRFYKMTYYPNGFDLDGIGKPPAIQVGWLRFHKGNVGRGSSDVTIRFHPQVTRADGTTSISDPCTEGPGDDLGEEEPVVPSSANTPGVDLPLTPPPVASPSNP